MNLGKARFCAIEAHYSEGPVFLLGAVLKTLHNLTGGEYVSSTLPV
jgi:hypothetical protein